MDMASFNATSMFIKSHFPRSTDDRDDSASSRIPDRARTRLHTDVIDESIEPSDSISPPPAPVDGVLRAPARPDPRAHGPGLVEQASEVQPFVSKYDHQRHAAGGVHGHVALAAEHHGLTERAETDHLRRLARDSE